MKLATIFAAALVAASSAGAAEAPKIVAIHAQLYHEGTGKLSPEDLLAPDAPGMWNTIIGENASNFTLVTVEVQGKDVPTGVKVQITARGYKRKIVGQRTSDVSIYDAKTKFFAPLFLYDTGCDEIEVSARLIGKGVAKEAVKKVIPFKCGE